MSIEEELDAFISESEGTFPSQFTIDFFEEIEEELCNDPEFDSEQTRRDAVGAAHYRVDNVIQIINPALDKDLQLFERLEDILKRWSEQLESERKWINGLLGD